MTLTTTNGEGYGSPQKRVIMKHGKSNWEDKGFLLEMCTGGQKIEGDINIFKEMVSPTDAIASMYGHEEDYQEAREAYEEDMRKKYETS